MPIQRVQRFGNTYECRNTEECAIHADSEHPYALGYPVAGKVFWLAKSGHAREQVSTLLLARRYKTEHAAMRAALARPGYHVYRLLPDIALIP